MNKSKALTFLRSKVLLVSSIKNPNNRQTTLNEFQNGIDQKKKRNDELMVELEKLEKANLKISLYGARNSFKPENKIDPTDEIDQFLNETDKKNVDIEKIKRFEMWKNLSEEFGNGLKKIESKIDAQVFQKNQKRAHFCDNREDANKLENYQSQQKSADENPNELENQNKNKKFERQKVYQTPAYFETKTQKTKNENGHKNPNSESSEYNENRFQKERKRSIEPPFEAKLTQILPSDRVSNLKIDEDKFRKIVYKLIVCKDRINKVIFRNNVFMCDPLFVIRETYRSKNQEVVFFDFGMNRFEDEFIVRENHRKELRKLNIEIVI